MTETVHAAADIRKRCDAWRAAGARVGLVPTMGALHSGHLSLIEAVRGHGAGPVVVSIFVNPLQFGAGEDLDAYPRTLEADLARLRELKVDLVFAPNGAEMYPDGFQTSVSVNRITSRLEGEERPTHFQGVTTVVNKLFNIVGPCVSAFGQKDYQQWRVLCRMVQDLCMPIEVIGCPIVRESDGLAMSSRNRYLSEGQRKRATGIFRGLRAAQDAFMRGERSTSKLLAAARAPVAASFDAVDYVSLADAEDLSPIVDDQIRRATVLLAAARLGETRLIDNTVLGAPPGTTWSHPS
ncbi:MAG: pantoate--beta-alanine ligase [Myxococcales bacterium]|nr:pantoate--beta-alanine ligase [Myxococcales bacterium]MDD9964615.1 pantoate--beta-alanine ligase [Myxococcales bacterium]